MKKVKEFWEKEDVASHYSRNTHLFPPEATVFEMLRPELSRMRMLDIGVGAGRTSLYFGDKVREYVAIDYSASMLEICKERFSSLPSSSFQIRDAANLQEYADESFDFVLFSYNGIDSVEHSKRMRIFEEIRRVCAPGAYFFFSSHNLLYVEELFRLKLSYHPRVFINKLRKYISYRKHNKNWREKIKEQHAIINDGAHRFSIMLYYIKPEEQIRQLHKYGFKQIEIFLLSNGEQFHQDSKIELNKEDWLSYLCKI